jgi:hypothetical protein
MHLDVEANHAFHWNQHLHALSFLADIRGLIMLELYGFDQAGYNAEIKAIPHVKLIFLLL